MRAGNSRFPLLAKPRIALFRTARKFVVFLRERKQGAGQLHEADFTPASKLLAELLRHDE